MTTMSAMVTLPVVRASAVELADVGNMNANSVAMVTGNIM